MNKDDIERMVKEAEVHAADDKKRKEEIETRSLKIHQNKELFKIYFTKIIKSLIVHSEAENIKK